MALSATNLPGIELPTSPPERCKILVVDDDIRVVDAFAMILGHDGYQILSATTGHAALKTVETQQPDVVVLDVILPDLDGIELCQCIKSNPKTRFLPVIMVTGLSARARRLDGLHAGADDFLNKPIDPLELTARVRSLLRTKQLHDALEAHRHELEQRVIERTQELRAAYERLQELNRVKDNVLAIVAHELRTPLLQVKSALNLAMQDGVPPAQKRALLHTVDSSFDLLEYRIKDIGVFSDPANLKVAPASATDLILGACEHVRILRQRQENPIVLSIPQELPPVMVDPMSMTRALAHIIDNGVKFGKGRSVHITLTHEHAGVRVIVQDEGEGIPEKVREHLFRPLQPGDASPTRRHRGMGIGLALVKMILDAHDIGIDIESQPTVGTTISLTLPLAKI